MSEGKKKFTYTNKREDRFYSILSFFLCPPSTWGGRVGLSPTSVG